MREHPETLIDKARRYRDMAFRIFDRLTVNALNELADEYETLAATRQKAETKRRIERRAHEIWRERGEPQGMDLDIRLAAEQEILSRPQRG